MTRVMIIAITILIVTILVINAFKEDADLPEQTTTIEVQEETEHFEETVEIEAKTPEDEPEVRKGTYEFDIDESNFRLDIEYHNKPDIFKITNISDLVSKLRTEKTNTPYRVYYNNRVRATKYWGDVMTHFLGLSYQKRIFKGFWLGPATGTFFEPQRVIPMIGLEVSFEW